MSPSIRNTRPSPPKPLLATSDRQRSFTTLHCQGLRPSNDELHNQRFNALTARWYAQPIGKQRDPHPFEDNPFIDDFLDWMGSPEGQISIEVAETLREPMDSVQLDARRRELIWPEAQRLSFDQSIEHILNQYPDIPPQRIKSFLISWLGNYAPEDYSRDQLDELDELTEPWISELERQPEPAQKRMRTRDS